MGYLIFARISRQRLDVSAISLSLVTMSLVDRPRLALYCSFVVNGARCGRKREGKIKRWQKEWDGKGDREMKGRESVRKEQKRSYRCWISAYTGFRAAMAVARWNIMLSHRLILSSRWKRDRWNSPMSLFPLVEKGNDWYVIFGYRVMMFSTLPSLSPSLFSFLFVFFGEGGGERERERESFF